MYQPGTNAEFRVLQNLSGPTEMATPAASPCPCPCPGRGRKRSRSRSPSQSRGRTRSVSGDGHRVEADISESSEEEVEMRERGTSIPRPSQMQPKRGSTKTSTTVPTMKPLGNTRSPSRSNRAKEAAVENLLDQLTIQTAGSKPASGDYDDFYVEIPDSEEGTETEPEDGSPPQYPQGVCATRQTIYEDDGYTFYAGADEEPVEAPKRDHASSTPNGQVKPRSRRSIPRPYYAHATAQAAPVATATRESIYEDDDTYTYYGTDGRSTSIAPPTNPKCDQSSSTPNAQVKPTAHKGKRKSVPHAYPNPQKAASPFPNGDRVYRQVEPKLVTPHDAQTRQMQEAVSSEITTPPLEFEGANAQSQTGAGRVRQSLAETTRSSAGYEHISATEFLGEETEFTPMAFSGQSRTAEGRVRFASSCGRNQSETQRQMYARRQSPYPYERSHGSSPYVQRRADIEVKKWSAPSDFTQEGRDRKRSASVGEEKNRETTSPNSRSPSVQEEQVPHLRSMSEARHRAQSTYGRGRYYSTPYEQGQLPSSSGQWQFPSFRQSVDNRGMSVVSQETSNADFQSIPSNLTSPERLRKLTEQQSMAAQGSRRHTLESVNTKVATAKPINENLGQATGEADQSQGKVAYEYGERFLPENFDKVPKSTQQKPTQSSQQQECQKLQQVKMMEQYQNEICRQQQAAQLAQSHQEKREKLEQLRTAVKNAQQEPRKQQIQLLCKCEPYNPDSASEPCNSNLDDSINAETLSAALTQACSAVAQQSMSTPPNTRTTSLQRPVNSCSGANQGMAGRTTAVYNNNLDNLQPPPYSGTQYNGPMDSKTPRSQSPSPQRPPSRYGNMQSFPYQGPPPNTPQSKDSFQVPCDSQQGVQDAEPLLTYPYQTNAAPSNTPPSLPSRQVAPSQNLRNATAGEKDQSMGSASNCGPCHSSGGAIQQSVKTRVADISTEELEAALRERRAAEVNRCNAQRATNGVKRQEVSRKCAPRDDSFVPSMTLSPSCRKPQDSCLTSRVRSPVSSKYDCTTNSADKTSSGKGAKALNREPSLDELMCKSPNKTQNKRNVSPACVPCQRPKPKDTCSPCQGGSAPRPAGKALFQLMSESETDCQKYDKLCCPKPDTGNRGGKSGPRYKLPSKAAPMEDDCTEDESCDCRMCTMCT